MWVILLFALTFRPRIAALNSFVRRNGQCRCEAASFLVAYLLGLPTFALAPNAVEAIGAIDACGHEGGVAQETDLNTAAGVNRLLVWLVAPVAAEAFEHRQLVVSDPRQALSLLRVLRSRGERSLSEAVAGNDAEDDELRVRCALQQADLLLKRHARLGGLLRERMESGSATVGNCVALVEENS
jgi:hypothetical protein